MSERITRAIAAYREIEPHAIINRAAMNAALNVTVADARTRADVIKASWQGLVVGAVLATIAIHLF